MLPSEQMEDARIRPGTPDDFQTLDAIRAAAFAPAFASFRSLVGAVNVRNYCGMFDGVPPMLHLLRAGSVQVSRTSAFATVRLGLADAVIRLSFEGTEGSTPELVRDALRSAHQSQSCHHAHRGHAGDLDEVQREPRADRAHRGRQ